MAIFSGGRLLHNPVIFLICVAQLYLELFILIFSVSLGVIIFGVTYCGCDCAIVAVVTVESDCWIISSNVMNPSRNTISEERLGTIECVMVCRLPNDCSLFLTTGSLNATNRGASKSFFF